MQSQLVNEKRQWVEEAVVAGRLISMDPTTVSTSFAVVLNAFGDGWLEAELPKCDRRKFGGISAGHPLIHALRIGQPNQVSEVVELAHYLLEFHPDPHLPKLIQQAKDRRHFENVILQLATAFRFRKVGAVCALEPSTRKGRADLAVVIGDRRWLVECSNQNVSSVEASRRSLMSTAFQRISDRVNSQGTPVALRIRAGLNATDRDLSAVATAVKTMTQELQRRPEITFEKSIGAWNIAARRLSEVGDPLPNSPEDPIALEWDIISECKSVRKEYVENFPKGAQGRLPGIPNSRLYLRLEGDEREVESAIMKKLDKKICQTSGGASSPPRWIVIGIQTRFNRVDWEPIRESIYDRFSSHERLAGVVICYRRYWRGRYGYDQAVFANGGCGQPVPRNIVEALKNLERDFAY